MENLNELTNKFNDISKRKNNNIKKLNDIDLEILKLRINFSNKKDDETITLNEMKEIRDKEIQLTTEKNKLLYKECEFTRELNLIEFKFKIALLELKRL